MDVSTGNRRVLTTTFDYIPSSGAQTTPLPSQLDALLRHEVDDVEHELGKELQSFLQRLSFRHEFLHTASVGDHETPSAIRQLLQIEMPGLHADVVNHLPAGAATDEGVFQFLEAHCPPLLDALVEELRFAVLNAPDDSVHPISRETSVIVRRGVALCCIRRQSSSA